MVDRLVVVTLNSRNSGGPILFFSFLMSSVCNLSSSKIAAQMYRIVSYLMLKVFVRVRPLHVNHCWSVHNLHQKPLLHHKSDDIYNFSSSAIFL